MKRTRAEEAAYLRNRRAAYTRDKWRCRHCNNSNWLTPHHIIFQSQSGTDDLDNLITLCVSCHNNVHDGHLIIETTDTGVNFRRQPYGA